MKTILKIKGMHRASCKALIEDVCKDVPGVESCSVDLSTEKAILTHKTSADVTKAKKEIEALGRYKAIL